MDLQTQEMLKHAAVLTAGTAELLEQMSAERETMLQELTAERDMRKVAEAKLALIDSGVMDPSEVHQKVASFLVDGDVNEIERMIRFREGSRFTAGTADQSGPDPFTAAVYS